MTSNIHFSLSASQPSTVGCIGNSDVLRDLDPKLASAQCDLIEIRLDLLDEASIDSSVWQKFSPTPLLFTARRASEGGSGDLDAKARRHLLELALGDAACFDIELASIHEMTGLIEQIVYAKIPWLASLHDFSGVPSRARLESARDEARAAGAVAFKAAVTLKWATDSIPELTRFLQESDGFPTALMGMGPLAPSSRLLFAQLGSILNYGYLGVTPTAPGQWSAAQLRHAIQSCEIHPAPAHPSA